jgi:phospholipid/cholesterol/gamma-HCH transport system permease protein
LSCSHRACGTSKSDGPRGRGYKETFGFRHSRPLVTLSALLKNYLQLNLDLLYWVFVAPFTGKFFDVSAIFRQMVFIGVRATSMVALTAFSVGVTLAMQAAHSLQQLGAEIYVPDLVMVTLLREMGPVLIAVIVIGRSGSAVAAELGTMKVSEEIEALEVMAINPIQYLVVPRFLAMLVMLPALTIFGNYIGVLGGWAVCHFALDVTTSGYIMRALESAETWDLYSGMIKSAVFAWIIITIACNAGLHVEGGAEGVGQATTSSVVQALLAMLVTNAVLTGIFFFGA